MPHKTIDPATVYVVAVTIRSDPHAVIRYVAHSAGEWLTVYADELKTWTTRAGAERWCRSRGLSADSAPSVRVITLAEATQLKGARMRAPRD